MTYDDDPRLIPSNLIGSAPGDSLEQAWQTCLHAHELHPQVVPPIRCQLVDAPGPDVDRAAHIDHWLEQLDPGEAVGWPVDPPGADDERDWYFMAGKLTRVEAES